MCMEGIEQNPVVYELTAEMAFHDKKVEVEACCLPDDVARIRGLPFIAWYAS